MDYETLSLSIVNAILVFVVINSVIAMVISRQLKNIERVIILISMNAISGFNQYQHLSSLQENGFVDSD